jgi:hypothetical protein
LSSELASSIGKVKDARKPEHCYDAEAEAVHDIADAGRFGGSHAGF